MRSQIRNVTSLLALVDLAVMVWAAAATAGTVTVFSNFGPNQSSDFRKGQWIVSGSNFVPTYGPAMSFTAGSTADIENAVLPLLIAARRSTSR